mmetsp:Transcript_26923/g.35995  ORF Transcript_26923/g.35995 Transcript_26923/m.35995 type:complete len:92 (-) Transcript_26923:749-1024(-)
MKAWVQASALAALGAAKSRSFVEGIGANGASGQFVRLSDASTVKVFGANNSSILDYTLTAWGVYYEDTGVQAVRIMAKLTANIFATDTVQF